MKTILRNLKCAALQFHISVPTFRTNQWDIRLTGKYESRYKSDFRYLHLMEDNFVILHKEIALPSDGSHVATWSRHSLKRCG
jgi:hypothetical protein